MSEAVKEMKWIEVRRHTFQDGTGHVTQAGQRLVEQVGATLHPPYAVLVASGLPRAVETAELFGAALGVHQHTQDDRLAPLAMPEGCQREAEALVARKGLTLLEAYFSIPACRTVLRESGQKLMAFVTETAENLKSGEKALAISHGGTIEPAALIALQQEFSLGVLGGELAECEGVTFLVSDGQVIGVSIHRLVGL